MTLPDPESFFPLAVSNAHREVYKCDIPRRVGVTD